MMGRARVLPEGGHFKKEGEMYEERMGLSHEEIWEELHELRDMIEKLQAWKYRVGKREEEESEGEDPRGEV